MSSVVVVGGTAGIGREIASSYARQGAEVWITGRDPAGAREAAAEIGGDTRGVGCDLALPESIAAAFSPIARVDRLVLAAIERDQNSVRAYEIQRALRLVTLKLVGYSEVVHQLADRFSPGAAMVLFGGVAKDRPYPGSTTVTAVNDGVDGLARSMAVELAPVRVNVIHPGIVGDSPAWVGKPDSVLGPLRELTPIGRLVGMAEVVDSVEFLQENGGVNGVSLVVDGGWLLR